MEQPKTPIHPDARCGWCNNCRHVEATKLIVLSHSAPSGPGITQREADLWNNTLRDNPCERPLVIVNLLNPPSTIRARLLADLGDEYEVLHRTPVFQGPMQIMTLEHGPMYVARNQVEPWTPERCLDGINFDHLQTALEHMPSTWYPALFNALTRGSHAANTFMPLGASTGVRRLELELLGKDVNESAMSGFASARAALHGAELKSVLDELLGTTELNLDEMEDHTRDIIAKAVKLTHLIENGK